MSIEACNFNGIKLKNLVEENVIKVRVTSAQLLALNATPKELVPAPGAGKHLEFLGAMIHKPAGTAYAGIAAGENMAIKYTNGSGAQVCTDVESDGFLDAATAQTRIARPIVTEYTPAANAALVLQLLSGEITTGTSDLYVTTRYRVWADVVEAPV